MEKIIYPIVIAVMLLLFAWYAFSRGTEVSNLRERAGGLEKQLSNYKYREGKYISELRKYNEEISGLVKRIGEYEITIREVRNDNNKSSNYNRELELQNRELRQQLKRVNVEVEGIKRESNKIRDKLNVQSTSISSGSAILDAIQKRGSISIEQK